jgi:hypothetical protein
MKIDEKQSIKVISMQPSRLPIFPVVCCRLGLELMCFITELLGKGSEGLGKTISFLRGQRQLQNSYGLSQSSSNSLYGCTVYASAYRVLT